MEKENLSEKAVKAIAEQVRQNVQRFTAIMDRQELNIDKIEVMWGELRRQTDTVIAELYNGLVNQIPEKQLIVKKKRKWPNRGCSCATGANRNGSY